MMALRERGNLTGCAGKFEMVLPYVIERDVPEDGYGYHPDNKAVRTDGVDAKDTLKEQVVHEDDANGGAGLDNEP